MVEPKGKFSDPIVFDIEFECTVGITRENAVRWEVIYVGSALSNEHDQLLADVFVGPIDVGMNRFVLTTDPPEISRIPADELPLSVVMLKAYYNEQEFISIGYYVQNNVPDQIDPQELDPKTLERQIITEDTTVHSSQIKWGEIEEKK